jgi:teichuronic acid exporter
VSLARAGIRGAYFISLALAFRQLVALTTMFYVARQLLPSDIGLFSMVMLVIGLAQVVGDVGIAAGLVRSQKNTPTVLSTCFWIGASIGVLMAAVVFLLAPVAGWFYEKVEVEPFLRVSALGLLLNFMMPVPMALLQQRLAYGKIAMSQSAGSFAGAAAAVTLVHAGFGIWGLVFQPIVGNLFIWALLVFHAKWRPTLQFELASARDILISGMHLLGVGLTGYFKNTFDVLVIGKTMTAENLGFYSLAQTILYSPMHLITSTVARVIFPILAKVQGDLEKIKEAVLTATSRTAFLVLPLYFGLFVLADAFVAIAFGPKWESMVLLIRIMSISFIVQSIGNVAGPLMLALNKTKMMLRITATGAIFYFVVLLILIPHGLTVVAIGYAAANSLIGSIALLVALHFAKISIKDYLRSISHPLAYALVMTLAVLGLKFVLPAESLWGFALLVGSGATVYALFIFVFEEAVWRQAWVAIRKQASTA